MFCGQVIELWNLSLVGAAGPSSGLFPLPSASQEHSRNNTLCDSGALWDVITHWSVFYGWILSDFFGGNDSLTKYCNNVYIVS